MSLELGPYNIRVNHLGIPREEIEREFLEMIPLRRPVAAEDVAGVAVFLRELLPAAAAGLLARSRAFVQRGSPDDG